MKKRISLILAAVLCLCLFTGAACDHDWQQVEEVGPMVCSRCGADECEALGHSFQDWEVDGDSMNAWCTVCFENVVQDFDPQLVGEHRLIGTWDALNFSMSGMSFDLSSMGGSMSISVTFYDDHTVSIDSNVAVAALGGDQFNSSNSGTWEFDSYAVEDIDPFVPSLGKQEMYSFKVWMDAPEGASFTADAAAYNCYTLYSKATEVNDSLVNTTSSGDLDLYVTFEKQGAVTVTSQSLSPGDITALDAADSFSDLLCGSWYTDSYFNGSISVPLASDEAIELIFSDDGSLSYICGGKTVGGTWTMGEAMDLAGMRMCMVDIVLDDGRIIPGTYTDGGQYLPSLTLTIDGNSYSFAATGSIYTGEIETVSLSDVDAALTDALAKTWEASLYTDDSEKSEADPLNAPVIELLPDRSLSYTENGSSVQGTRAVTGDVLSAGDALICDLVFSLQDGREFLASFNSGLNGSIPLITLEEDSRNTLIFFEL